MNKQEKRDIIFIVKILPLLAAVVWLIILLCTGIPKAFQKLKRGAREKIDERIEEEIQNQKENNNKN